MIKTITSLTENGEELVVDLSSSMTELGMAVVNIDGLGSPKANINGQGGPNFDGMRYNSARAQQRNIVISMAIPATGAVEETARKSLYQYFPIKKKIQFGVVTDTLDLIIDGYVEDNNVMMFSKVENTTISLICPQPYFSGREMIEVVFSGTNSLFTFPFSNQSTTKNLIVFGEERSYISRDIIYTGNVETGLIFTIRLTGPASDITIYNVDNDQSMAIYTDVIEQIIGGPLQLGDEIVLDTRSGYKSVYLTREGGYYNILNAIDMHPRWITLKPGLNRIVYEALVGVDNVELSLKYRVLYEGV